MNSAWSQTYDPISHELFWSSVVAAIPIVTLLLLLGVLRKPAWMAALAGLAVTAVIAIGPYHMPRYWQPVLRLMERPSDSFLSRGLFSGLSSFTGLL